MNEDVMKKIPIWKVKWGRPENYPNSAGNNLGAFPATNSFIMGTPLKMERQTGGAKVETHPAQDTELPSRLGEGE
jgi:hypothetical protein